MTRLVPMIGHPVEQTKLPDSFNRHAAEADLALVMERIDILPAALVEFVDGVRSRSDVAGVVSTIPHKSDLAGLVDERSAIVESTAVCNAVRRDADGRLHGDMLDGLAMCDALEANGAALDGAEVSLVGCGAAGTAIAHELLTRGAVRIQVRDLEVGRSETLVRSLRSHFGRGETAIMEPGDATGAILVNASPVGMHDDRSPFTSAELGGARVIADAITDRVTPLLAAAADRRLVTVDGAQMAAAQLAPLLRLLSGGREPSDRDR